MDMLKQLRMELKKIADSKKAQVLQRFFKTGKGEYGEEDIFLGITVPISRKIANKYRDLDFAGIKELIHSRIHEERLIALLILVHNFNRGNKNIRERIYKFYLGNTKYINNWDLVDLSAPNIVGEYLLGRDRSFLYELVKDNDLWKQTVAILATFAFIRKNDFKDTLKISELLLHHEHDLIHKAVGWMLREVGKRNRQVKRD